MVCCCFPLPYDIPEEKVGFFTRIRLGLASTAVGESLSAEKAEGWAPIVFRYLSNRALSCIPSSTLLALDGEKVRQISTDAILTWDKHQVLAVVNKLSLSQLQIVSKHYAEQGNLSLLHQMGKGLSPRQIEEIKFCNPESIAQSHTLYECLQEVPRGFRSLALATYYFEPSTRSTEELLRMTDEQLQNLLPKLGHKAIAHCFSAGDPCIKMAVILPLSREERRKVRKHLSGADEFLLVRVDRLMERSLDKLRKTIYQKGYQEGYYAGENYEGI